MDAIQRAAWQSVTQPVTLPVRRPFAGTESTHPQPLFSFIVTTRAFFCSALQGTLMHNPFIGESPMSKKSKGVRKKQTLMNK